MDNKKNIIMIAVGVVLLVFAVILVFSMAGESQEPVSVENGNNQQQQEVPENLENVVLTRESHLFKAGTDGVQGARNEGLAVTEFDLGDLFGLAGRYQVNRVSRIQADLLDQNQNVITTDILSSFRARESGTFSMCCGQVPDTAGTYYIKIHEEGRELELLPFTIR